MSKIKIMSVFSGVGGLELGLDHEKFEVVGHSEINKSSCLILNHRFPEIKNYGDITKIDSTKLPKFDMLVGGSPCFRKGTLIHTENGLKKIEEVELGEKLLTHNNRYMPVLEKMVNHATSIHLLKAFGLESLYVTEGHPLYCVKKNIDGSFTSPEWVAVKDITKQHYLLRPIIKNDKKVDWNGINKVVNQSTEKNVNNIDFNNLYFWEFLGRYVGDGWVTTHKRKERKNSYQYKIKICCGKSEKNELNELFNNLPYKYGVEETDTTYNFTINNQELHHFLKQFGKDCYSKKVPNFIFDGNDHQIKAFIKGYYESDGCLIVAKNLIQFTSVSKELLYGVQSLIHKVYHKTGGFYKTKATINAQIQGRQINSSDYYTLHYRNQFEKSIGARFHEQFNDDFIAVKVTSNKIEKTDELVYNFEVEDDHSYVANNIVAHNCQNLSMAGNKKGLAGAKSSLFFIFVKLLKENNPDYFIWENVKGTFFSNTGLDFLAVQKEFHEAGYHFQWQLLNSEDFGVAQVRNRVFVVGSKRKDDLPGLINVIKGNRIKNESVKFTHFCGQMINEGLVSTITASYGALSGNGTKIIEGQKATKDNLKKVVDGKSNKFVRLLTHIESERLMSWKDDWTKFGRKEDGTQILISDRERYRAIGNGIVSNCIKVLTENFLVSPIKMAEETSLANLSSYSISNVDEYKKFLAVFKLVENEDYIVKGKTVYIKNFKFVQAIFNNETLRVSIIKLKHSMKGILTLDKNYMKDIAPHDKQSTIGTIKLESILEKDDTNKKYLSDKECAYIYSKIK